MSAQDKQPFKFSESPTLEEIRSNAEKFVTERDWNQFHTPRNILLALVINYFFVRI